MIRPSPAVALRLIRPLAMLFLHPVPAPPAFAFTEGGRRRRNSVLGLPPNLVLALIAIAGFCCCVPMALPQSHLVAFCSDLGIPAARGAIMLSVLQACAFVSRQFWGWMADRVGGLLTLLAGSACQTLAVGAFMLTQDEAGLFAVSAAYGLGFSGIVPAYVLVVRDLYPSSEASLVGAAGLVVGPGGLGVGRRWGGAPLGPFGFFPPPPAPGGPVSLRALSLLRLFGLC